MTNLVDGRPVVTGKPLPATPLDDSELPQVDDTAQGLQRDQEHLEVNVHDDADAPEPVGVVADGDNAIIPVSNEKSFKENTALSTRLGSRRRLVVLVILLVLSVLALVLGLAIGLTKGRDAAAPVDSTTSTVSSSNTQAPASTPTPTSQIIMNDSSFAAGMVDNGDKVLFFQDDQHNLRRAVYTDTGWTSLDTLPESLVGLAANNTPLSLFMQSTGGSNTATFLYFLNQTNHIVEILMLEGESRIGMGSVLTSCDEGGVVSARQGSRHLSAVAMTATSNNSDFEHFLLFEDSSGNVSLLHRSVTSEQLFGVHVCAPWTDITSLLTSSRPHASFQAPFASSVLQVVISSDEGLHEVLGPFEGNQSFSAAFYDTNAALNESLIYVWYNATNQSFVTAAFPFLPRNVSSSSDPPLPQINSTAIKLSDMVLSTNPGNAASAQGYWVNGSTISSYLDYLATSDAFALPPGSPPFPRLATLQPMGNSSNATLHLYHQANGSSFVELSYDATVGTWAISSISAGALPTESPWSGSLN